MKGEACLWCMFGASNVRSLRHRSTCHEQHWSLRCCAARANSNLSKAWVTASRSSRHPLILANAQGAASERVPGGAVAWRGGGGGSNRAATYSRLLEALSLLDPAPLPFCAVWGYGRPLWDPAPACQASSRSGGPRDLLAHHTCPAAELAPSKR